jgi:hypothetical protein
MPPSRIRVVGIRVKELLAIDFIAGDHVLALRRDDPIDELLTKLDIHIRCFAGFGVRDISV